MYRVSRALTPAARRNIPPQTEIATSSIPFNWFVLIGCHQATQLIILAIIVTFAVFHRGGNGGEMSTSCAGCVAAQMFGTGIQRVKVALRCVVTKLHHRAGFLIANVPEETRP